MLLSIISKCMLDTWIDIIIYATIQGEPDHSSALYI